MNPTKLIATYYRVSTSKQEDEQTIKTQVGVLKEHADKHGYTIVKEYSDDGWSGDMLARPALDELRQDAKGKLWEAVLIYDPDRLARRYSYQELIMDELKEAGIEVMFVTVAAPKNSEDKILHGVRGLFAEYERVKISERFRLGKLRKVKEGNLLVSEALYGYTYIPKAENIHGYYVVNEEEARIVKMIFAWVDEDGFTLRTIVKKLQELGIKPRRSKRGVWNTSTLSTMLRHRGYIGEAKWGSSYAVVPTRPQNTEKYKRMKKTSRRIKPKEEWYTIPIPAIIEPVVFTRVQERLRTNFLLSQRNTKNEYLLAGHIYCTCGRRRAGEGPQKGKHLYYRCTDRVLSSPLPPTCTEKGVNARIADSLIWEGLSKLMTSPALMQKQIKRWVSSKGQSSQNSIADIHVLEKQIVKLHEEEGRYSKAYGSGVFTIQQLKEYLDPIKAKILSIESQIANAKEVTTQQFLSVLPSQGEIETFAQEVAKAMKDLNFEAKKAIVRSAIEKVEGNKEKLTVCGYIPVTSNINVFPSYRHRRASKRR